MKTYLKAGNIYIAKHDDLHFTAVVLQPGFSEIRDLSVLFDWDEFKYRMFVPITLFEFQNAFNTALSKIIQNQTIEMEKDKEAQP